jgi:DNA-binding XRE family transcriptional regulator
MDAMEFAWVGGQTFSHANSYSPVVYGGRIRSQYNMIDPDRDPLTPVDLRKRANLTQRKLAEALDIRQGTISDWERGLAIPHLRPSQLKRMMEELNCTLDDIIEAYEKPKQA